MDPILNENFGKAGMANIGVRDYVDEVTRWWSDRSDSRSGEHTITQLMSHMSLRIAKCWNIVVRTVS